MERWEKTLLIWKIVWSYLWLELRFMWVEWVSVWSVCVVSVCGQCVWSVCPYAWWSWRRPGSSPCSGPGPWPWPRTERPDPAAAGPQTSRCPLPPGSSPHPLKNHRGLQRVVNMPNTTIKTQIIMIITSTGKKSIFFPPGFCTLCLC